MHRVLLCPLCIEGPWPGQMRDGGKERRRASLPLIPLSGPAWRYHGCNEGSFISISAQSHHSHRGCSSSGMRMSAHCLEDGHVCAWYEDGCLNAISDAEIDLLMYLLS